MFLAIINDTYSEVKADLSTQESEFDLGAFLKKGFYPRKNKKCYFYLGYSNMLSKMNMKKDRLKDFQDALKSADQNSVSKNSQSDSALIITSTYVDNRMTLSIGKNGVLT